jgi:hypothetical protein
MDRLAQQAYELHALGRCVPPRSRTPPLAHDGWTCPGFSAPSWARHPSTGQRVRGGRRSNARTKPGLPKLGLPKPTQRGRQAARPRSAVEEILQDGSCAAGAFLATEIDVRRHARPAVPELVCGISRRQSSLTHQGGHALSECVTAESRKARTSER